MKRHQRTPLSHLGPFVFRMASIRELWDLAINLCDIDHTANANIRSTLRSGIRWYSSGDDHYRDTPTMDIHGYY